MIKKLLLTAWTLLKDTLQELLNNDPIRMAGATSFFATFALPPIIIIIVRTLGIFFSQRDLGGSMFIKLSEVLGPESADQIRNVIRSFRALQQNYFVTVASFIFLLFVATTLFRVVKSSLNQLWNIRVEKHRSFKSKMGSRLHSVVIILLAGCLFLVVLLVDAFQSLLEQYFMKTPQTIHEINSILSELASITTAAIWFFVLFIYLPDGRPPRHVAMVGAILTALLFRLGRFIIGLLLSANSIGNIYGASGAMVFMLLFVFYSSIILYFGAAFTKVWGQFRKQPIKPLHYAAHYRITGLGDTAA
ncbi:MAG: YihY/virulence factor BrkB family protein [Bacteroidetes bacterium]|nr:YihY/virulence factor BrkB family protein [Bacteroidota bacterium]